MDMRIGRRLWFATQEYTYYTTSVPVSDSPHHYCTERQNSKQICTHLHGIVQPVGNSLRRARQSRRQLFPEIPDITKENRSKEDGTRAGCFVHVGVAALRGMLKTHVLWEQCREGITNLGDGSKRKASPRRKPGYPRSRYRARRSCRD